VLIENSQGIKTFCEIFKIIFLNRVLVKFWATKCFQQSYFCFKSFEIQKGFLFDETKAFP
jgi:hypothetical protein